MYIARTVECMVTLCELFEPLLYFTSFLSSSHSFSPSFSSFLSLPVNPSLVLCPSLPLVLFCSPLSRFPLFPLFLSPALCLVCLTCSIPILQNMEANWKNGRQTLTRIECHSENSKGVYCLQYDDKKIVSGLRDNTIKVSAEPTTRHMFHCCVEEQRLAISDVVMSLLFSLVYYCGE